MAKRGLTWQVFVITGQDVRGFNLTDTQVEAILAELEKGNTPVVNGMALKNKKANTPDYQKIYNEAIEAGNEAGKNHNPRPMVVQQHANMADDDSKVVKQWFVPDGPCGFAWVNIKGNTGFAKWLHKKGIVKDRAYEGGYNLWCSAFGQSYERKLQWAIAVAKVLQSYNITARADGRLD